MTSVKISLPSVNDVRNFVGIAGKQSVKAEVASGTHNVSAMSIMGLFSLDLSKPVNLNIFSDDADDYLAAIKDYVVA